MKKGLLFIIILAFTMVGCFTSHYFTFVYHTNNEQVFDMVTLESSELNTLTLPNPTKDGYTFGGWFFDSNFEYEFELNDIKEGVNELYAKWLELTYLPALVINLKNSNGESVSLSSITKEDYVDCSISLVNTDDKNVLNNVSSKLKGRGNGSWEADKKGYKIKFDKKQSLFGHEANKHWVIIACENFDDTTMFRNYLAYSIGREILDGIEYASTTELLDVYINGNYCGVYLLCEHVRVGKGRVNIESEYGVIDTGYLIEYDAYASGENNVDYFTVDGLRYPFSVHSPDPKEYESEGKISKELYSKQVCYIKEYVTNAFNAALNFDFDTFSEYVDIDSFVDMYILHELFKNVDTGWSSFYLYKKPGGKLFAGPPWDFDATTLAARGDNSPQGIYVADSASIFSNYTSSELYISLYKTNGFKELVIKRWKYVSPQIDNFICTILNDETYSFYKLAMGKNFAMWKNKSLEVAESDWLNDILILKQWILSRIEWLNAEWT